MLSVQNVSMSPVVNSPPARYVDSGRWMSSWPVHGPGSPQARGSDSSRCAVSAESTTQMHLSPAVSPAPR